MVTLVSERDDVTEIELLGVVMHVQGSEDAPQFCRVRPIYRQLDQSWAPITDPKSTFPDIGLVFWWHPNTPMRKGDAFQFYVFEDPMHYEEGQRKDRFHIRTDTAKPPIELLKLAYDYDLADLRRQIAAGTLAAPSRPRGQALILLPDSSRCIGLFEPKSDNPEENALTCDTSSGFIRSYDVDESLIQAVQIDDTDHSILRPDSLLSPSGYFSVQTDLELVRTLANLVRRESETADAELFRKRAIDDALRILSPEGGGSRDRARDGARLEAAQALKHDLVTGDHEREQIQKILESLPAVETLKSELNAAFEKEHAQRFAEIHEEVRAAFEAEQETANQDLTDTISKTNALKSEAVQLVSETKTALGSLIDHAVSKIAEHTVVRELLRLNEGSSWSSTVMAPTRALQSLDAISEHVLAVAGSRGEDPYVAGVLAALMAGSQITLLAGSRAFPLASTIAYSLGGGGACVVPITPTIFSFGDLLNAPCGPMKELPCHGDCLGEFITKSMQGNALSVVILQGLNRTPPEDLLLELIDSAFGDFDQPIRWRDLNGKVRTILLDRRILFLATLTEGPSIHPIPREFGSRLPLLWSERREMPERADRKAPVPCVSVLFDTWKTTANHKCEGEGAIVGKLKSFPSYAALHDVISKLVGNVCGMLGSDNVGTVEAIWSITCGRLQDEELKAIASNFTSDQAQRLYAAINSGESERVKSYFESNETGVR
jgi:hypothetical protein